MEKKERLWNANYNRVMITNFTLFFSFYLMTPLLPLYLSETFHATKDMIGLVLSGFTLVALLMRPMSGFLVDTFPRKLVLMTCLATYFILFGGYLVAGSVMFFAVIRTLHGGPYGACTVANTTMAIDVLPSSRRNEGIGYYGLSNNLASALAPTVGILIYQYTHNFDLLFWLAFITAGFGLINTYYVDAPKRMESLSPQPSPLKRERERNVFSLDRFFLLRGWFIAINICLFGFCWGLLSNYLAIYGKEHLGITGGTGVYFFILSVGLMASRIQGSKALREGKLIRSSLEGILLSTVGYTIFIAWPTNFQLSSFNFQLSMLGYYASAVLIGLGNGHIWPAFMNLINNMAQHNERGTANSTLLTSWDLGMGIGILLGGVIAEAISYDAAFWTMVGVHFVGLFTFLFVTMPKSKKFVN